MEDVTTPTAVSMNGHPIDRRTPSSSGPGWYYQANTNTVVVNTPSLSTTKTFTVVATGSRSVDHSEPPATSS